MSVRTKAGGLALVLLAGVILARSGGSWFQRHPPDTRPPVGNPDRFRPVLLIGAVDAPRDTRYSWTVNGTHPAPEVTAVTPWEKEISATVGSTVTFTVQPLIGGPGEHTCRIEQPPGTPVGQTHASLTGGGTTPIMCTAVIGI